MKNDDAGGLAKDTQQLLRYALPGIACVIEFIGAFFIAEPESTFDQWSSVVGKDSLIAVLGLFLASGALGYILANIYFVFMRTWPLSLFMSVNHLRIIRRLTNRHLLSIVNNAGVEVTQHIRSRRAAWEIVTSYFHTRISSRPQFKPLYGRIDGFVSMLHGLGATLVGTVLGAALWGWICIGERGHSWNDCTLSIGYWLFLIVMFTISHHRLMRAIQRISNSMFAEMISDEASVGSSEFLASEFGSILMLNELVSALVSDGITVPRSSSPIEQLNGLLKGPSLHKKYPMNSMPIEVRELMRRVSGLTEHERIRLNRLILESVYPTKCPKMTFVIKPVTLRCERRDAVWSWFGFGTLPFFWTSEGGSPPLAQRKGFFRVCVVLSCLWTLFVLGVAALIIGNLGVGRLTVGLLLTVVLIAAGWAVVFAVYWTMIWVVAGFTPESIDTCIIR